MNAEVRIVEAFPKLKYLKNNSNDIISMFFISDNYTIKIADVDKAIKNKEKILIKLKELKERNIFQKIKCSLIRNKNIIGKGEIIPKEGLKWYTLNDIKNISNKESPIPSLIIKNIKVIKNTKNNSNNSNNNKLNSLSDPSNLNNNNELNIKFNSKKNFNRVSNSIISSIIKIKLLINISNKKNKYTLNRYDSMKRSNYTKESSLNCSKDEENILKKGEDIFSKENFTLTECQMNGMNLKDKKRANSKNTKNKKYIKSFFPKRIFTKNKIYLNKNQIIISPINSINNNKNLARTTNNSKVVSPKMKNSILNTKKFFIQDRKMKTSSGFYKFKNQFEDKERNIKIVNSCQNIEDEIIDENFKNHLKNDEILKVNISRNNSYSSFFQKNTFNTNSSGKGNNNINNESMKNGLNTDDKKIISSTARIKNFYLNNNLIKNIFPMNKNNNINNYFSLNNYYEFEIDRKNNLNNVNKNNKYKDINLTNTLDKFENLKKDFFILYPNDYYNKIKDEDIFLEIQLMIEKILELQFEHQKEYIILYNSIINNKNLSNNYQKQYISYIKKLNKLNTKKICYNLSKERNKLFNENINNFISVRKKILDDGEFLIWNKMAENPKKFKNTNNKKQKMNNIFLDICDKNESSLNMLSLKFYKKMKKKQLIKSPLNKKSKDAFNLSAKNIDESKKRIKIYDNELKSPYLKTNNNLLNNIFINVNQNFNDKFKQKIYKKELTKFSIFNQNEIKNNIRINKINYGTLITEKIPIDNYQNIGKEMKHKNKSSSIRGKTHNKKKDSNKSQ